MSGEAIALIVIAVFQAGQTLIMILATYILKDLKDRVARLESIEMQAAKDARERPLR